MAEFDIIFFNCGENREWYFDHFEEVRANVRDFVVNGGSVYASDWAYYFVESAFPAWLTFYGNDATFGAAYAGDIMAVSAEVVDPVMEAIIGSPYANINFDLPGWAVLDSVGPDVDVLLRATVNVGYSTYGTVPIAARFNVGEGRVIYTAFHNEHAATTLDMTDLLEEIILSL